MKLRIQGNSLRLRVTQKEVAQLCDGGHVESSIALAPGQALSYSLDSSRHVTAVSGECYGSVVHVIIPANLIAEWAAGEQVGIEGRSQAGAQLLVEKDFQCLHKPSEQDSWAHLLLP